MKKILYFMAILFAFSSCSLNYDDQNEIIQRQGVGACGNDGTDSVVYTMFDIRVKVPGRRFVMRDRCVVITIDSCEYLYIDNPESFTGGSLSHKGNCKYCAERRRKEIEAAVRKSLNQNNYSNYGKSETDDTMSDLW